MDYCALFLEPYYQRLSAGAFLYLSPTRKTLTHSSIDWDFQIEGKYATVFTGMY